LRFSSTDRSLEPGGTTIPRETSKKKNKQTNKQPIFLKLSGG
jgi:hypothetical protein